jgi:uncharacterized membrane protein
LAQDDDSPPIHSMLEDLVRRFDQLAQRVESIEERLTREDVPPASEKPAAAFPVEPLAPLPGSLVSPTPTSPPPTPPITRPTTPPIAPAASPPSTPLASAPAGPAGPPRATPTTTPTPAWPRAPKPQRARPALDPKNFEWLLGARGLALAGVVIVVFGVGLFLKLAYDEGWIGNVSPAARCGGSAAFGLVLVALGEVLRRKVNPLASSGATAAGLAIVYASILSATKLYDLIDTPTAFLLLAAATTGGVLLGSLSTRVMLSMLSLIGAFAVPLLLRTGEPSPVAMPAYLLSLLVLGLALSAWRGGAYSHVRRLAWWGTGLLGTLWLSAMHDTAPTSSLVFVSVAWLVTVAELVASARFLGEIRDRVRWPESTHAGFHTDDEGEVRFNPASLFSPEARWVNSAFGATIWATTAAAITLRAINPELDALAPAGFGLASILIAFAALGLTKAGLTGLWPSHPTARTLLADALILNATMLGVATIATALGGWVQVVTWAAVGLGAIETARRLRFRAAGIFGMLMVGVAVARLFSLDLGRHLISDPAYTAIGLAFTAWSPQLVLVAGACAAAAWRCGRIPERPILGSAALWLTAACVLHPDSVSHAVGPAMLVLAAAAGWVSVPASLRWLRINAMALAGLGLAVTLLGQLDVDRSTPILRIHPVSLVISALAWVALAALPRAGFKARSACAAIAIVCGSLAIARLEATHGPSRALLFGSLYAGAVLLAGTRLVRWSLAETAVALLYALTVGLLAHTLTIGGGILDGPPFTHASFPPAILTVLGALAAGVLLRRLPAAEDAPHDWRDLRGSLSIAALALAWALLLATSSVESVRSAHTMFEEGSARGAVLSIWWSLFAVGSVVLGFRLGAPLRWAGLALLGVVAVKVLVFDTVTLNPPARVVAAITVGLIIIGASVLYARLVGRAEAAKQPGEESGEDSGEELPSDQPAD